MKKTENGGFSLIELLIGIAILSVVGLCVAGLFGSSVRMYHSTITYADVQTESQTISRQLTSVIMDAGNIYYEDTDAGTFLFTGSRQKGDGEKMEYSSKPSPEKPAERVIWFNKSTGCLYQCDSMPFIEMELSEESDGEKGALSVDKVKDALENEGTNGKMYLISSMVKDLDLEVDEELTAAENQEKDNPHFYKADRKLTVNYTITMQYLDGKEYTVSSAATTRNRTGFLRWRKSAAGEIK